MSSLSDGEWGDARFEGGRATVYTVYHADKAGGAMRIVGIPLLLAGAAAAIGMAVAPAIADELNDYPTTARADYVLACMKANGETRHVLEQCSCSIDVIASVLPYERYVTAEAVLSVGQVQGNLGAQFRTSEPAKAALNDLRRAQAEAEVRCF